MNQSELKEAVEWMKGICNTTRVGISIKEKEKLRPLLDLAQQYLDIKEPEEGR